MGGRPAGSAALQWPEPKPEPRGAARAKRPPDLFENQGAACAAARLMALCSGPWMNARLLAPRMVLALGCSTMSMREGSLTAITSRHLSASVRKMIILPKSEL